MKLKDLFETIWDYKREALTLQNLLCDIDVEVIKGVIEQSPKTEIHGRVDGISLYIQINNTSTRPSDNRYLIHIAREQGMQIAVYYNTDSSNKDPNSIAFYDAAEEQTYRTVRKVFDRIKDFIDDNNYDRY